VAEKILDINRRNQWAYDKMHRLYRDLKNWPKAAEYLEKSIRFGKKKSYARLIALYKVQEGFEKYRGGDYHEARLLFRKAAKIDPKCEAAYYYIANSYVKDQRQEDAIPWWEKFAEVAPAKASLVFPYLQKVLFNMGNFNQIESFYQNILRKRPEDIQAHLALASFYDRKGDRKRALEICEEMKDKNPDSVLAKITLAKYLLWNNQIQKSSEILDEVIDRLQNSHSYTCSRCGAVVDEVRWLCPICGEPDTFLSVI